MQTKHVFFAFLLVTAVVGLMDDPGCFVIMLLTTAVIGAVFQSEMR